MRRFFAVFATDKPGMRDVCEHVRPNHRSWLRSAAHGVLVRLVCPTLAPQCDPMNGTLLVVEAEGIDDVMAFVSNDPYIQAGLFDRVDVRRGTGASAIPSAECRRWTGRGSVFSLTCRMAARGLWREQMNACQL